MGTYYKKLLLIAICLAFGYNLGAQERASKKIEKSYAMTNAGELHLDNKYGNVIINGWNKNNIAITVDVKVSHRKKDNARELLNRISAEFKVVDDFIGVTSVIAERGTGFFARYFNKANPFDFDKTNVQINYTIYLPVNAEIDIKNKFGDVIMGDWTGKLKARVTHGDMWINDDLTNANIVMEFGKLRTKAITYGSINMKNGGIDLERSQDLRINSSGTTIKLEQVSTLDLFSSKDEVTIESVGSIVGDLRFSNVQIQSLGREIGLRMKLVDFRVGAVESRKPSIKIDQESSEIYINVDGLSFDFEANLEQGLLRIPTTSTNIKTNVLDRGKKIREIKASYGKGDPGTFSVTGIKGVVVLREQ
ncbi:hypothetical protein [Spongiimicrobium sp. 3-5]|uniref:hypothetical protein n=1 Tax=Spongiimicrobium sp. 3-5 TaxID=3332596 RepID=UPI003980B867